MSIIVITFTLNTVFIFQVMTFDSMYYQMITLRLSIRFYHLFSLLQVTIMITLRVSIWFHHNLFLLQVMIFLIDKVLPEGYFANNLRALSVDMAVFRDLLKIFPKLSRHLEYLQHAQDQPSGKLDHWKIHNLTINFNMNRFDHKHCHVFYC